MPHSPPRFRSRIQVSADSLDYTPALQQPEINGFDCGDNDLNEFLTKAEFVEYANYNSGDTVLVWQGHTLVGYYTTGRAAFDTEDIKKRRGLGPPGRRIDEELPAIKIARLAVDRRHQRNGIGRIVVAKILDNVARKEFMPELVVVRANPRSIDFWEKCGFKSVSQKGGKRSSKSMTLFFPVSFLNDPDVRSEVVL